MTINSEEELKQFLKDTQRAVVVFGKPNCLHCGIVENVLESIKAEYPLIKFGYTLDTEMSKARHFNSFPTMCFYEYGCVIGMLYGSGKITQINDMLNLWFRKD